MLSESQISGRCSNSHRYARENKGYTHTSTENGLDTVDCKPILSTYHYAPQDLDTLLLSLSVPSVLVRCHDLYSLCSMCPMAVLWILGYHIPVHTMACGV
jgi:hypothetical protein